MMDSTEECRNLWTQRRIKWLILSLQVQGKGSKIRCSLNCLLKKGEEYDKWKEGERRFRQKDHSKSLRKKSTAN